MRRSLVAVVVLLVAAAPRTDASRAQELGAPNIDNKARPAVITPDRIPRLARWLKAVDRHEPGEPDDPVDEVSSWTIAELRGIWVDVNVLSQLMRNIKLSHFLVSGENRSNATSIAYSSQQLRQMATLACAAGGMLVSNPDCLDIKAAIGLDDDLVTLAAHAAAERSRTGDPNYVLRRGALLHGDAAMLRPHGPVEPLSPGSPAFGPQSWRMDINDGRGTDVGLTAIHWDIARLALDRVLPRNSREPAPQRDPMVRAWYRATAAWMQWREDHDTLHLAHARRIFPDDPDLLFLSGCQHETYASPAIQAAAHSLALPAGFTVDIGSDRAELRQAEGFLRKAVVANPRMGEAHLRLGRVLGLLGRHVDALAELRQAEPMLAGDELQYYAALFAGADEEALERWDAAREQYQRASALFPLAQSPFLALSELAHRRGDRAGAAAAMQKVFELPSAFDRERDDPWWRYHVVQARNAEELLDEVAAPFRREPIQ